MNITPQIFEKVKATEFLRPKFSNISFEYVHTKLVNKAKRRGNYRFRVILPYRLNDQIQRIETHFVLQPQRSPFFITHTLRTGGMSIDDFLEFIPGSGLGEFNGNAVVIQSEDLIDCDKLEQMKNGLIEGLIETDPESWELKSGRICIDIDQIGIYKFKPLIAF